MSAFDFMLKYHLISYRGHYIYVNCVDCRDGDWWFAKLMLTEVTGYIPNNYVAAVNGTGVEQHE